jgi:hypothetical protein
MVLFVVAATAVAVPIYLAATTAFAAGHLKIEGIAGSSTRPGREKWVDILSFHWGVTPAGNPGPESKMLNFTIAAGTPESEKLVNAARAGTRFRAVTFDSGEKVYRMRDVGVRWIGRGGTK